MVPSKGTIASFLAAGSLSNMGIDLQQPDQLPMDKLPRTLGHTWIPGPNVPIEINVFHSGKHLAGSTQRTVHEIPTPFGREKLIVRSHFEDPIGTHSPTYIAAIRRQRSGKIRKSINALEAREYDEDFFMFTQEPLAFTRNLIHFLDEAEQFSDVDYEGNACEVLRQIRDSFLNKGWELYRQRSVRSAVSEIVQQLSTAESITPEFADECMDKFMDLGLEPVITGPIDHEQEETDY